MTDRTPPLTEAELRKRLAFIEGDRHAQAAQSINVGLLDYAALLSRALEALTLESELAQLRREKAELDAPLKAIDEARK